MIGLGGIEEICKPVYNPKTSSTHDLLAVARKADDVASILVYQGTRNF
jgi:hypothetical protein